MIRKILLYTVVIIVIIAGAPYLTGMLVETKFHDVARVLTEVDSIPVSIQVVEYKRGWRKSTARTIVTTTKKSWSRTPVSFEVLHEIRHGPFVQLQDGNYKDWDFARALIASKILMNEQTKAILISELGDPSLMQVSGVMYIGGSVEIKVNGNPLKLKKDAGTDRVAWKGIEARVRLNSDLDEMNIEGKLPGVDVSIAGMQYQGSQFTYKGELERASSGLWPGKVLMTLESLSLNKPADGFSLSLNQVASGGLMEIDDGLADISYKVKINQLILNQTTFGPISFSKSIKHVDEKVVKAFIELTKRMRNPQDSPGLGSFLALLPDLLKTRPDFSVDELQINTPSGLIEGRLSLAIGGPNANDLRNLPQLMQSMVMNAYISMPRDYFRDLLRYQYKKMHGPQTNLQQPAPNQSTIPGVPAQQPPPTTPEMTVTEMEQIITNRINGWLKNGFLLEKDNIFTSQINYQQGKLSINGIVVENPAIFLSK